MKRAKPISKASEEFIRKTQTEFSQDTIELGNKLINEFTRADINTALLGDKTTIDNIAFLAMRKGWIENLSELPSVNPDMEAISMALSWIKAMRSITAGR